MNNQNMNKCCLYSIIIPHYNSPQLLKRCLDSIPDRNDVEILVIDDNSDNKLRPTSQKTNVRIINIPQSDSKGAGHARNVGIANAIGDWLLFADCDDYYNKGFLDALDKYVDRKELEVVYFNFRFVDNELCSEMKYGDGILQKTIAEFNGCRQDICRIRFRNYTPWTKMVRRSFVIHNHILFEEVPNGNDILFSFFIGAYACKIAVEKEILYTYVKNNNSISTRRQNAKDSMCRIVHSLQVYNYLKSNKIDVSNSSKELVFNIIKNIKYCHEPYLLMFNIIKNIGFIKKQASAWVKLLEQRYKY